MGRPRSNEAPAFATRRAWRSLDASLIADARIVIDTFHAVRVANDAIERVRKSLRESLTLKARRGLTHDHFILLKRERDLNDMERLLLSGRMANYPELGEAYRLKAAFYGDYGGMAGSEPSYTAKSG